MEITRKYCYYQRHAHFKEDMLSACKNSSCYQNLISYYKTFKTLEDIKAAVSTVENSIVSDCLNILPDNKRC